MTAIDDRGDANDLSFAWRSIDAESTRFVLESAGDVLAVLHVGGLDDRTVAYLQEGDRCLAVTLDRPGGCTLQVRDTGQPAWAQPIVTYQHNLNGANGALWVSAHRLGSLRPGEIGTWRSSTRRRRNGLLYPDYVITDRDDHVRIRFGTDGSVLVLDLEAISPTCWTELLAVLALGWLLVLTAGRLCNSP
jgi:hypothetical protein